MCRISFSCLRLGFLLLLCTGCANLEAKKVPLPDRLKGTDDHVKGFRYYVSRPYLVVAHRVCVGQHLVVGYLMQDPGADPKRYIVETIDEAGSPRYLDTQGHQVETPKDPSKLVPVEHIAAGKTPGSGAAGGKDAKDLMEGKKTGIYPRPARAAANEGGTSTPEENFQFVMLPDFEEQIAIKDCNFAAKGKYTLKFGDGWQLRSVSGSWDSTEVAVKALQVLSTAVKAAAEVQKHKLDKMPIPPSPGKKDEGAPPKKFQLVAFVQATYVEPGFYRLQKSSERKHAEHDGNKAPCAEMGILSDLGIPTTSEIKMELLDD